MNKKLYIGNLPFSAEEAQLKALFSADGRQVTSVHLPIDKLTGRARGFGFVEMATFEDAAQAIQALHGHDFMGRPMTVSESRETPPGSSQGGIRGLGGRGGRNSGQRGRF